MKMSMKSNNPFLQVSVNSEKLSEYLSNIQKLLNDQQYRTQQINRKLTNKFVELQQNLKKLDFEVKRNEKQLKQSIINEALIQKDNVRKLQDKTINLFEQYDNKLSLINGKMSQDRDKASIVQNKTQYAFQQCKQIKTLKNMISNMEKELGDIKSDSFKNIIEDYINKSQQQKLNEICQQNFFKILENDKIREIVLNRHQKSLRSSNPKRSVRQKEAMFYASISDKLDKLQKKLSQKGSQQINKVLYPSKNPSSFNATATFSSTFRNSVSTSQPIFEQTEVNNMVKEITGKIQNIQNIITKKILQLRKQLVKELEKGELMNEKIAVLTKKLEKQKARINDLALEFKKYSQKKIDEKIIQSFRYQIRQKTIDYQDNLDLKINKDIFDKQKTRTNQRIRIVHQNLTQKADKTQVKKAITFLQSKIKEIILLIAGSYDQDREGSIKKSNFKCLSCDKDLQTKLLKLKQHFKQNIPNLIIDEEEKSKAFKKSESAMKLRCATSRMRRHIRLNSGSTTPSNIPVSPFAFD